MCNLSQGIWENGNKHGKKIGKKQGKKQGINLGIDIVKAIQTYYGKHFTLEETLNMVVKRFHISKNQAKKYISLVYK